jgi:hypothetical protein
VRCAAFELCCELHAKSAPVSVHKRLPQQVGAHSGMTGWEVNYGRKTEK